MRPHRFDPVSAALGVIAAALGSVVAFDGIESIDVGWWLALGALVLGLGLVPWTRSGRPADGDADPTTLEQGDPPRLRL